MKTILLAALFIILSHEINAQALTVGDRVPEDMYNELQQFGEKDERQKNGKEERLLLLDFWSINCSSCIAALPKMSDLQQKFDKELKILFVSSNDSNTTYSFLKRKPMIEKFGLPIMIADSVLHAHFPHYSVPHVVWIGRDRVVKAITTGKYSTSETVKTILKENRIDLPLKIDELPWDENESILSLRDTNPELFLSTTAISTTVGNGTRHFETASYKSNTHRLIAGNRPLNLLYLLAYRSELSSLSSGEQRKRIILNIKDSSAFVQNIISGKEPEYTYESIIHLLPQEKTGGKGFRKNLNKMKKDLDVFFGFESRIDTLPIECYIISADNSHQSDKATDIIYALNETQYISQSLNVILGAYQLINVAGPPIIFESNTNLMRSAVVKLGLLNLEDIVADLKKNGITLRKEVRRIPMLVISDARK